MIDAKHELIINTPIDNVWDYVQDMRRWAEIFPGCRECEIIDQHDSHWTIKVGVGGLVRTVKVLVHVDQWSGPERVDFSFKLEAEPVVGNGSYSAMQMGPRETEVTLAVAVEGSGQMAPMWEAMCRPLLPQLARSFSNELKGEIEKIAGVAAPEKVSLVARISAWLRGLWQSLVKTLKSSDEVK